MEPDEAPLPPLEDTTVIERINKADLVPLFDANHEHQYIRGGEDEDGYYDEVCSVKGCGMGRLIAKT